MNVAKKRPSVHGMFSKVLSNTIETNFQILSTKYAKFQPNIQIFDYSISCLVSPLNLCFNTNNPKRVCSWQMDAALMFMILKKLADNFGFLRNFTDQMPSHTQKSVKEFDITYLNTLIMIK